MPQHIYTTGPTTKRLTHRALSIEDAETFYALNSHPEIMRYTGEPPLESLEQAQEAIANYPDFHTVGYGRWGCILKETNQLIGFCGLKYLDDLDCTDIGFRFFPEHWGNGLATEAAAACIDFGFKKLNLQTIAAFVLPENTASIRVLEKCEFQHVGTVNYDGHRALQYKRQAQREL